ncbi:MAG: hypothetical protein ACPG77_05420 [Nannocystaceae bacterium]
MSRSRACDSGGHRHACLAVDVCADLDTTKRADVIDKRDDIGSTNFG